MKKLKKNLVLIAAAIAVTATLCFTAACGESGFEKFANYITANGTLSESTEFVSMSVKADGIDYSAMFYLDDRELVFGIRSDSSGGTDALLLVLGENADICDVMFTSASGSGGTVSAIGVIMLSDPECTRLTLANGAGNADDDMLSAANGYIDRLLGGLDVHLFADSGLKMSDLGFAK